MAVTHQDYTGDGSTDAYEINAFDFLDTGDIKVTVAGVSQTVTTNYTVANKTLTFTSGSIPANNAAIRIYRNTNLDTPKHTFQTGASVKADSLNLNNKQLRYYLQELGTPTAATTGLALTTGNKNDIEVVNANDWVIRSSAVESAMIANDAVTSSKLDNDSVATAKIADDAVTVDKLANSINTEIAANTAKTTNATHTGEVTGATALTITDNIVDEANLKISNAGTNGQYLQKQSGNTGGLTWADISIGPLRGFKTVTFSGSEQTIPKDAWTDVTDLSITYTPTLSSSIIVLEAHLSMYARAEDQSSGTVWSDVEQQFIVTPTGGSAATVAEFQAFSTGAGTNDDGVSYAAALRAKWNFYEEYTNSNTTEKTFKVQLKRNGNGTLRVNNQEGHSYFTLKEYTT